MTPKKPFGSPSYILNVRFFSKFDFPGSGYVCCAKNKIIMFVAKLGISVSNKSYPSLSPIQRAIQFRLKGNNKPKPLFKRVVQIGFISCQSFQEICIKM